MLRLGLIINFMLVFVISLNAQHIEATSINLNSTSQYGGDYPTKNSDYTNVLSIGGIGAESGLKIYKQYAGTKATFAGPRNYHDAYVFEMTDYNENNPDGAIVFGGTGKDHVFENIMMIKGNGNVGIGTKFPTSKLSVNGKIKAKEVQVVASGWPDYVFEPNYQLIDLKDLEEFISQNRHLPDVPSAQEVEEHGISMADMDARLLKKIEELTLYVIELNKIVAIQDEKIKELENNIK